MERAFSSVGVTDPFGVAPLTAMQVRTQPPPRSICWLIVMVERLAPTAVV
jgi:hypothetical protein